MKQCQGPSPSLIGTLNLNFPLTLSFSRRMYNASVRKQLERHVSVFVLLLVLFRFVKKRKEKKRNKEKGNIQKNEKNMHRKVGSSLPLSLSLSLILRPRLALDRRKAVSSSMSSFEDSVLHEGGIS